MFYIGDSRDMLEIFQLTKGCPDIHIFPIVHTIKTHFCWKIFEYQDHPTRKILMQQYHWIFFQW